MAAGQDDGRRRAPEVKLRRRLEGGRDGGCNGLRSLVCLPGRGGAVQVMGGGALRQALWTSDLTHAAGATEEGRASSGRRAASQQQEKVEGCRRLAAQHGDWTGG